MCMKRSVAPCDEVWPTEYGQRLEPWFLFTKKYWLGETHGSDMDASVESAEQGENFEPLQPEQLRNATVKIRNLKKTFKNGVTAVDDLSVTFAPGGAVQVERARSTHELERRAVDFKRLRE